MLSVGVATPLVHVKPIFSSVWCDNRTEQLANELVQQTPNNSKEYYRVRMNDTRSHIPVEYRFFSFL